MIEPYDDVLPFRSKFGSKNVWNIGVNYLSSKTPLWYSIADLLASKLYTGRTPKILKAYKFVPKGIQKGLKTINILGVKINPYKDDLFQKLIEYRHTLQNKKDSREYIIKIIANSISYGIFVEIITLLESKKVPVQVFGLENFVSYKEKIEKSGYMFNPIIAVCITSASRLLLAATEIILSKHGKIHAYCDTDSMMVPPRYTTIIQDFFRKLNPYSFDAELFKQEHSKVLFYGISAKRYCLFSKNKKKIKIIKHSSHGLGHLLNPLTNDSDDDWHKEIWKDILDLHYNKILIGALQEKYENKFSLSKLVISNPHLLNRLKKFNKTKSYHKKIKPFNFSIVGSSNQVNPNTNDLIKPLAPYRKPTKNLVYHTFTDYNDKTRPRLKGKEFWKSFLDIFEEYLNHPESKFEGDIGVLKRKHVQASQVLHNGKESNNLDDTMILGVGEDSYLLYENRESLDQKFNEIRHKILELKPKDVKEFGISKQTLWNVKRMIKSDLHSNVSSRIKVKLITNFAI